MHKIKIFVVAPYKGLNELVKNISLQYDMFDIETVVGNLGEGVKAAVNAEKEGFQIILSRGGTAELIEKEVSIPVVSIDISGYDYMRVMMLANSFSGKPAMVGYHSITEGARAIKDVMNNPIDIFTIDSSEELPELLTHLQSENYRVVVGDVITVEKARAKGFNAILLTSGEESVRKAFTEARKVYKYIEKYSSGNKLLAMAINAAPQYCAIFGKDGIMAYCNIPKKDIDKLYPVLLEYEKTVWYTGMQQALIQDGEFAWNESGRKINDEYIAFYLSKHKKSRFKSKGVYADSVTGSSELSVTVFGRNSKYLKEVYRQAQTYGKLRLPILIIGEIGTGKDALARTIHSISNSKHLFLTVDGEAADEDGLKNSRQLLAADESSTVYLRMIDKFTLESQRLIFQTISDAGFSKRHMIIASVCGNPDAMVASGTLMDGICRFLGEYRIRLPSLRERPGDIRDLTSNYISEANLKFGKQVVSADDNALKLLTDFPWPANLDQLKRVIFDLVFTSEDPYIHADDVSKALENEEPDRQADYSLSDKTLEQITKDIINKTVEEEKGNLSQAAKRLGISRSTLWRHLKN